MTTSIAAYYDIITSYSHLYEDEIDRAVEDMGHFARTYDIIAEVRSVIYSCFMNDMIFASFISSSEATLEDAIKEFETSYAITEEEFVLFKK